MWYIVVNGDFVKLDVEEMGSLVSVHFTTKLDATSFPDRTDAGRALNLLRGLFPQSNYEIEYTP